MLEAVLLALVFVMAFANVALAAVVLKTTGRLRARPGQLAAEGPGPGTAVEGARFDDGNDDGGAGDDCTKGLKFKFRF